MTKANVTIEKAGISATYTIQTLKEFRLSHPHPDGRQNWIYREFLSRNDESGFEFTTCVGSQVCDDQGQYAAEESAVYRSWLEEFREVRPQNWLYSEAFFSRIKPAASAT